MPTLNGPDNFNNQFTVAADGTISLATTPFPIAGGTISPGPVVINGNTAVAVARGANTMLQINGSDNGGNAGFEIDSFGAGSGFSAITMRHSGGTGAAPAATPIGSVLGQIQGRGYGATGWSGNRSSLNFTATENWDDTHQGVNVTINATPTGGTATAAVATFQAGMQLGAPAGGDLGLGTLNMAGQLQVNQNAANPTQYTGAEVTRFAAADSTACIVGVYSFSGAVGTQGGGFTLHKKRGTGAAPVATQLNDNLGALTWNNFDGTNEHQVATIQCLAAENTTATNAGGLVNFLTAAIGQTALTTRMQIGSAGGLVVGAPTGGDKGTGTLNATGVYASNVLLTSDATLKRDLAALPDGCLDLVASIEPKAFRFIDPGPKRSDEGPTPSGPPGWADRTHWGFVAQDVERVMTGHDFGGIEQGVDGIRSLSHSDLLALLWQAVREMRAKVAALESATVH